MFTNLLAYAKHSLSLPLAIWEMQDVWILIAQCFGMHRSSFVKQNFEIPCKGLEIGTLCTCKWEISNSRGKSLAKVEFADCKGGPHDLRAVERKVLLEDLAGELPKGTSRFNSCVSGLKKSESRTGISEVELQECSSYSAKVVIRFDGVNSCVAS